MLLNKHQKSPLRYLGLSSPRLSQAFDLKSSLMCECDPADLDREAVQVNFYSVFVAVQINARTCTMWSKAEVINSPFNTPTVCSLLNPNQKDPGSVSLVHSNGLQYSAK